MSVDGAQALACTLPHPRHRARRNLPRLLSVMGCCWQRARRSRCTMLSLVGCQRDRQTVYRPSTRRSLHRRRSVFGQECVDGHGGYAGSSSMFSEPVARTPLNWRAYAVVFGIGAVLHAWAIPVVFVLMVVTIISDRR